MSEIMNTQTAPQQTSGAFRVSNLSGGAARRDLATQWIKRPADERFLSLSELRDFKRREYDASHQQTIRASEIEVLAPVDIQSPEDLHSMSFGLPDGVEAFSTNWAFAQACGLAKAPASYLRTIPSQIGCDALNYGLRYNRQGDEVKVYRTDGEDASMMRALTGPDYGRIPDYEVVEAVMNIAGEGIGDARWKVPGVMDWSTMIYDPDVPVSKDTTTLFASDRDIFIFLVDDKNPIEVGKVLNRRTGLMEPDLMFRGFYITNSEVGTSALKLAAFYLRAICCNRILWGCEQFEELSIRHSKMAPDRFLYDAQPALRSFADRSARRLMEGVEKAKAAQIAASNEAAIDFLRNRAGLSIKRAQKVLETVEREEGHPLRSAWDAANGISAIARNELNNDTRVTLELTAKQILDKVAA